MPKRGKKSAKKTNFGAIFLWVRRLQTGFLAVIPQNMASDKKEDNIRHTFPHISHSGSKEIAASIESVQLKE